MSIQALYYVLLAMIGPILSKQFLVLCGGSLMLRIYRIKTKLQNGEIVVCGDQWPLFLNTDYRYDPKDPWNGLFCSALLVSVGIVYIWMGSLARFPQALSHTKHVWYSEHGMYCRFEIILERAMSATHIAVIPCTRTHSDEEEFPKKKTILRRAMTA